MSLYDEDEIMEDPPSFDEDIGVPLDDEDMEDQVTKYLINVCSVKKDIKRSSNTLLHLVSFFTEQTLLLRPMSFCNRIFHFYPPAFSNFNQKLFNISPENELFFLIRSRLLKVH